MSKINTFLKLIHTPMNLVRPLSSNGLLNWLPDKIVVELEYKAVFGEMPNLISPKSFNEKLQWLKLYNRQSEYTMMVDKYKVREYISEKIGNTYLVPLLGHWNNADEIQFEDLPAKFVLKCNHDQGSVVICRNKAVLNINDVKKKMNTRLKRNVFWGLREWPYKNVKPCIIAEKYLSNNELDDELSDYKVLCFNGEPKLVEVHKNRFGKKHTQDFYDINWNRTGIQQPDLPMSEEIMSKPIFVDKMIELSKILATGIPHVRVDWYYSGGEIYFSELTFFDGSGLEPFFKGQDELIGSWLKLPVRYET